MERLHFITVLSIRITVVGALLNVTAVSSAQDPNHQLNTADEKYRAGDFDDAMQDLEPILASDSADSSLKQRAREIAARVLQARGEEHFGAGRIAESIADFDRQVELQPDREADHWQRGIAYYYAGEYEKGARQFELHKTVNPQDVENAAWHFLCEVRSPKGSVEAARKTLIPVTGDSRIPMAQIQQMFAGSMMPEEVAKVGEETGGVAKFYADLYVGLYYEAIGRDDESIRFLKSAADNPVGEKNYMGDVARVHVTLRREKVLRHAVFFKFKESSTMEEANGVVDAFRALPSKIKEIHEFQSGENISESGLSDGLTHCFVLTFKDEAGRATYLPHPDHKAFGASLGPYLEKVFVIDYWGRPQRVASKKELKHAVFFKFKESASDEEIRSVEMGLADLPSKISAIKAFEWGKNNSPESHDDGFTHCFMFTFDSEEALKKYVDHPAHKAVANELKPKVERIRVFDFWAEDAMTSEGP